MPIQKQYTVPAAQVKEVTVTLVPTDCTIILDGGEVSRILMTYPEGRTDLKTGDDRLSSEIKTAAEALLALVADVSTDQQVEVKKAADAQAASQVQAATQFQADIDAGLKNSDGTLTDKGIQAAQALNPNIQAANAAAINQINP